MFAPLLYSIPPWSTNLHRMLDAGVLPGRKRKEVGNLSFIARFATRSFDGVQRRDPILLQEMITGNVFAMDTVLESLIRSPKLPAYVQKLESLLTFERERREKFYEELTEDIKAEFINGEVFMHSPARRGHILATGYIYNLLHNYVSRHQLGEVLLEKALVCLTRNDYEPDLLFYGKEKAAAVTLEQVKHPAPDFVVEVLSETTEKNDRGVKFEDYAAHGTAEYWIVDADVRTVEQFRLEGQAYRLPRLARDGDRVTSIVVTGFDIPVAAIFDDQVNRQALLVFLGVVPKT